MPMQTKFFSTRRQMLGFSAGLAGTAALIAVKPAAADMAQMSKAAVGYQDVPQNGQVCAACVYFIFKPSTGGTTPCSRCKLVAGPIAPAGWCEVWVEKA